LGFTRLKPNDSLRFAGIRQSVRWISAFAKAEAGSVATLFALALPAILGLMGGAVDYAAFTKDQHRLQSAADATALSIAREMTLGPLTPDRIQALAASYAAANFGNGITATGTLVENGLAVQINLQKAVDTPFGLMATLAGATNVQASATARVTAASAPSKLCVLSLGEKQNGGIFMHNGAAITAPECVLHSNSGDRESVIIAKGSRLQSSLLCARGGIVNDAGTLQSSVVTDCPVMPNPLENKPEPPMGGACIATNLRVRNMEQRILQPGVYCGGVTVENTARLTLAPGIYVFRDGPLIIRHNAELLGSEVTLLFSGRKAYFRFLDNSLIRLSAPSTGMSAGMLIWEARSFAKGLNSWQDGGCGGDDDNDDDGGKLGCNVKLKIANAFKKTNEHHINSDRARELTGTIYLRQGMLLVDSRMPIADQSPFTVLVVNKLDLFDGPNLILNANFSGTTVPVPAGLGPIGGKNVRLGK
jgi:Flp pilus assembly protein TadG